MSYKIAPSTQSIALRLSIQEINLLRSLLAAACYSSSVECCNDTPVVEVSMYLDSRDFDVSTIESIRNLLYKVEHSELT